MYSSNNQEIKQLPTSEGLSRQDFIVILARYKISIISVIFTVFFLTGLMAIFKADIYQAKLTMQIDNNEKSAGSEDIIANAVGIQTGNLENEIAILQSRSLIQEALEQHEIGTRYFVSTTFKTLELYKDSPIQVKTEYISERAQNLTFHIRIKDKNHYILSIKPSAVTKIVTFLRSSLIGIPENEKPIDFAQTYSFGSKVQHPDFQFVIDKIGVMDNSEYSFTVVPNDKMYKFIQQSLTAVSIVKSELVSLQGNIIEIAFKDTVAQRAEEILNSLAEAYIDRSISIKELVAKQKLKFIDEQLASINASLNKSSGNIKNYKTEHVFVNLDDKARLSSMKLDQLESKLSELDMQESVLTNLLSYLNNNKDISGIDVGATDIATSPILSLIEKIQTVNTQYASLLTQYTEKHPSVIQVQKQLTSLRASLRETLESSLRGINQRKATLKEIIKVNKESLEGMPEQEEQLSELTRSFMVNNKVFEYLLEKRIEAAIAKSSTISSARIIDNANADQKPIEPNRILMIVVGLFLGIIIGVLQAIVRNYFENTIQSISDLEKRTFVPLYATLPIFSSKKSLYEDSLRMLLTKLEYMEPKPKVVTITSSVQGEGKTSTAIEFASIMASNGKKVILLEMDIRGSGINKRLKINGQGLESYLNGSVTLKDIKHSIAKNMDVIISDVTPSTSYSVIISEQFESLLVNLRSEYDYIILESPPAGIVVDALALMRLSDLCFIVFKAYYSKKDFINNMNRFVQEYGLSNIGLILNGLELGKIRPWYKK